MQNRLIKIVLVGHSSALLFGLPCYHLASFLGQSPFSWFVLLRILKIIIVPFPLLIRRYTHFGWAFPWNKDKGQWWMGSIRPANDVTIFKEILRSGKRKHPCIVKCPRYLLLQVGRILCSSCSRIISNGGASSFVGFQAQIANRITERPTSKQTRSQLTGPRTVVRCRILDNAETSNISHNRCYETDKEEE